MSAPHNINSLLDDQFKNHDFLPKRIMMEDLDRGVKNYFNDLELTVENNRGNTVKVPIRFLNQERWAEFKVNWQLMNDEGNTEVTMPYLTLRRTAFKHSESPLKRYTIPGRDFKYIRVPTFDGLTRGETHYKIPQPTRVDVTYELRFFSHYIMDSNKAYEQLVAETFKSGQAYFKINEHWVHLTLNDTNEENTTNDISNDRFFQTIFNVTLHGIIVDETKFKQVKTITKIQINIKES